MSGVIKEVVKGYFFINISILFVKGNAGVPIFNLAGVDITLIIFKYLIEGLHFK